MVLPEHNSPEHNSPEAPQTPNGDTPYDPNKLQQDNDNTTSSMRITKGSENMHYAHARVDKATAPLTGKRCLIENTHPENDIEYAHVVCKATEDEELARLEYHWNMDYRTLNLNTRYNIFILCPKYHTLLDNSKCWFLLPEEHIIAKYREGLKNSKFPVIKSESGGYIYTFVGRDTMKIVHIYRQGSTPADNSIPNPTDFTHHVYPYANLGQLVSHIHPRFAIFRAGELMHDIAGVEDFSGGDYRLQGILATVLRIYQTWIAPVTDVKKWNEFTGKPPPSDIESTYSHSDGARTTRSTAARKLTNAQQLQPNNPTPSKKSKKGPNDSDVWLDNETLRELDEELPPNKTWESKAVSIMDWAATVQNDVDDVEPEETSGYVVEASPALVVA